MYVIGGKANQLGNQLFLFGTLIASAREHHTAVAHLTFGKYGDWFESTAQDLWCRYPERKSFVPPTMARREQVARFSIRICNSIARGRLNWLSGSHLLHLESGYETTLATRDGIYNLDTPEFRKLLRARQLLIFQGPLFRDMQSLRKHADAIRRYFRPRAEDAQIVARRISQARGRANLLIGLHVRLGDYQKFMGGKFWYSHQDYAAALEHVRGLFSGERALVLVCSNETIMTDMFREPLQYVQGSPIQDLYALSQCDYIIGPPSTFSQWASFYGNVPMYSFMDIHAKPDLDDFRVAGM